MLEKLGPIIDKINILLIIIGEKIIALLKAITPKVIKDRLQHTSDHLALRRKKIEKKRQEMILKIKMKTNQGFETLRGFQYKEKIDQTKEQTISFAKKAATKAFLVGVLIQFKEKIQAALKYISNLNPSMIVGSVAGFSLTILAGIQIYFSGKKITRSQQDRAPAAVEEHNYNVRPKYYKSEKRFTVVSEITMPVYFNIKGGHRRVLFDLTLKLSNRHLVQFIRDREYELKDYINSNVEPFPPDFPLTIEGKQVIKEKILEEVNSFIKKHGGEGELEAVFIDGMISG